MAGHRLERLGATAGLMAWAVVAVPVFEGQQVSSPPWLWWVFYLATGALFAVTSSSHLAERPQLGRRLLVPQVAAGVATFVLAPQHGFSAVLLVINAASAVFLIGFSRAWHWWRDRPWLRSWRSVWRATPRHGR